LEIKTRMSYTYSNDHKHAVTSITLNNVAINTYDYDASGNMITRVIGADTYTLTYDDEGRLTNALKNHNQTAAYVYDGDGKMVKKTENGVTSIMVSNLVELQLPSDPLQVTPTLTNRTATVPSRTPNPTLTRTPSPTSTPIPSNTLTATSGVTRTATLTFTPTSTPTQTYTKTSGPTPTRTPTPSKTYTPSKTFTQTGTPRTPTTAFTPSQTVSKTPTKSRTPTRTNTPPTYTPTRTPTFTNTPSVTLTQITLQPQNSIIWRFYYYAGPARIAMRIKDGTNNLVFYLFTDHLGSTNVTSDPNGLMVSLSLYKAWGKIFTRYTTRTT
jgi:YD repeat-containing protein